MCHASRIFSEVIVVKLLVVAQVLILWHLNTLSMQCGQVFPDIETYLLDESSVHNIPNWKRFITEIKSQRPKPAERLRRAFLKWAQGTRTSEQSQLPLNRGEIEDLILRGDEVEIQRLEAIFRRAVDLSQRFEFPAAEAYSLARHRFYFPEYGSEANEIRILKSENKKARHMAKQAHGAINQRYGPYPYIFHLHSVRRVLKDFANSIKDQRVLLKVGTAIWLHDLIEDTRVNLADIYYALGLEMGDVVYGVTNVAKDLQYEGRDEPANVKKQRERITKIRNGKSQLRRLTKLADRMSNTEMSMLSFFLGRKSKIDKYRREFHDFVKHLRIPGEAEAAWEHLHRMTFDENYAREFLGPEIAAEAARASSRQIP
jgi:hypothetical protein